MRNVRAKVNIKQAVILCGGLGSRLGKITKKTPKPLIKINNKPFLDYLIFELSRFNIQKVLLLCSYKSKLFFKKYDNKKIYNINISCIKEKTPMGTFGALLNAKKKLNNFFFLLNGDTYFNLNLRDFQTQYEKRFHCSVALLKQPNASRYTSIKVNKQNEIIKVDNEKKNKKYAFINSGVNIINKKLFNIKLLHNKSSLEKEVFPYLTNIKKLQGVYSENYNSFIDIGVQKDLVRSHKFIKKNIYKPAVFLDRDGVINEDLGYVHSKKNFIWRKNIIKTIKLLNDNNFYVLVITNQSGVGRGYYAIKDVVELHKWINVNLNLNGAYIDDFFFSPYFKNSKIYSNKKYLLTRKPNIGMIKLAQKKWNININKSWVVGDQITDIQMAKNAKIKSILIKKKDNVFKLVKNKILGQ